MNKRLKVLAYDYGRISTCSGAWWFFSRTNNNAESFLSVWEFGNLGVWRGFRASASGYENDFLDPFPLSWSHIYSLSKPWLQLNLGLIVRLTNWQKNLDLICGLVHDLPPSINIWFKLKKNQKNQYSPIWPFLFYFNLN